MGLQLRIWLSLGIALAAASATAANALAHGERSQEGFLRMETVTFSDVSFSTLAVRQGEELTITGRATILELWPTSLGEPKIGYVNVDAPGPVMLMQNRLVNGVQTPDAFLLNKGATYDFTLVLVGREPGRWHVHPALAIQGAGTLIGPGEWITVEESGGFTNSLTLLNGQSINLETYNLTQLSVWHWLGFAIGLAWVLYWTVTRPSVTRLALATQLPLNSDGHEFGMVTRKDHQVTNWLAIGTVAMLALGWTYQQVLFPVTIPQQVVRFEPPALPAEVRFAQAQVQQARFDPSTGTLTMDVLATNTGTSPMRLRGFNTSNLNFVNPAVDTSASNHALIVDGPAAIEAGQTQTLRLALPDPVWAGERLIEASNPRIEVAGQLVFQDNSGALTRTTVISSVIPKLF
jgi:methane/ammonia monooxygenase subunit B